MTVKKSFRASSSLPDQNSSSFRLTGNAAYDEMIDLNFVVSDAETLS
jgi:hypothetical protein